MTDDTPESCYLRDILQEIATRKRQCTITYRNKSNKFTEVRGEIVDIYAAEGADWCKLDNGSVIRLDKIEEFE